MSTQLLERPEVRGPDGDDDDELAHTVCECNLKLALCGADLTGAHQCPADLSCGCQLCIVCEDLIDLPCRLCGA